MSICASVLRHSKVCTLIRSAANFVQFADSHRCHGTFYKPRDGLRTVKDLQKEIEEIKQGKEEDPLDYNMFGDKKLTSDDAYYYSDRSAGKGYRDFANGVYDERPYIPKAGLVFAKWIFWPLLFFLFFGFVMDSDWLILHGETIIKELLNRDDE